MNSYIRIWMGSIILKKKSDAFGVAIPAIHAINGLYDSLNLSIMLTSQLSKLNVSFESV